MTRVSKNRLNEKVFNKIIDTFWELITLLEGKNEVESFFLVFLSKAEKVMLAKRLVIAIMLTADLDWLQISRTLKVSSGTIRDVNYKLGDKKFRKLVENFTERFKEKRKGIGWLEVILGAKTNMQYRSRLLSGDFD